MKTGIKPGAAFFCTILLILFFMPALYKTANAEHALILAVHPYLSPEELLKKFTPLADYLSRRINKPVEVRIGSSYEEHIRYIGQNKVDIAYMGPASYVKMVNQFGNKPVLARLEIKGKPWFQGNIITRKDSTITSLNDLKGKRIAYGDPASTMSYIVPHHMLYEAGIYTDPTTRYQFLYSHDNVALGVLSGDFDAGAVKPAVFKKFEAKGLRTIAKTPKISEHLFVTRSNLPAEQINKLRHIMLNMKDSKTGIAALHAIKKTVTGLARVDTSDYDNLQKIIIETQLIH